LPVTAKLSRRFYEKLGDDVATELVDWFNAVDSEYRAHLERMNDTNWERFRAESRASSSELRSEMQAQISALRVEMHQAIAEMHKAFAAQNRFLFGYWLTTMLAIAAMFLQITKR
jgi:hypothetical protein